MTERDAGPAPHEVYAQILARELRTPVSAIVGYLELLEDEELLDNRELLRQYLAAVRGHASDLARIVDELAGFDDLVVPRDPTAIGRSGMLAELLAALRAGQSSELREELSRTTAQALRAIQDFRAAHRQAATLAGQLDRAYLETVMALAKAVEARDGTTGDHVKRVRRLSLQLGDALGMAGEERRHLEFAAVLHDVGKLCLPDAVLAKPGQLSAAEWAVMREHPVVGRQLLEGVAFLAPVLDAVLGHHERWDGTGYPVGLAEEGIPLAARIIAVADAYDAMTTDRPYRPAMPLAAARAELEQGKDSQFDPALVDAFLRCHSGAT